MTITLDIAPEVQAELARQAAVQGRALEAVAAALLEEAVHLPASAPRSSAAERRRAAGRKSLVEVFAPLRGLNLDFSRNKSAGRPVDLA